jgi:hypothetical protein
MQEDQWWDYKNGVLMYELCICKNWSRSLCFHQIDVCNSCKKKNSNKSSFWSAPIFPIYINNFCKIEHLHKWKFWNALNWWIDVGNISSLNTLTNQAFGVHSIAQ